MTVCVFTYTLYHNTESGRFFDGYKPGDRMVRGFTSMVETTYMEDACEMVFAKHNRDDRPDGQTAPSLSVGDVVFLATGDEADAFAVRDMGFEWVEMPENVETERTYLQLLDKRLDNPHRIR